MTWYFGVAFVFCVVFNVVGLCLDFKVPKRNAVTWTIGVMLWGFILYSLWVAWHVMSQ